MPEINKIYPLAPVDDILENVGLPVTKPLADMVSPKAIISGKLGLEAPGDVVEGIARKVNNEIGSGMPRLF